MSTKEEEDFYRTDAVIDRLLAVERDLQLHKLNPKIAFDLEDPKTRNNIRDLLTNLDILLGTDTKDPRLLRLITKVQGLRSFVQILEEALKGSAGYKKWLERQDRKTIEKLNGQIDRIVAGLDDWTQLAEKKVHAHLRNAARNQYLKNLPHPKDQDYFYIMVKELGPHQVKYKHQFNMRQFKEQQDRSSEDLMKFDPDDPITGKRSIAHGDIAAYPASDLHILEGHHRTFEIYRRFLKGEIDGDAVILVKKHYD